MRKLSVSSILLLSGLAMAQPKTDAEIAKSFVRVIQKADTAGLIELLPTAMVYRMTAPEETEGKSDSEIYVMAQPLREDILMRFRVMLQEADSLAVDLSKLKYRDYKSVPMLGYPGVYGMRIFFNYQKKKGEFTIGTFNHDDAWYIYAIDQDVGIFSSMETVKK